MHLEPKRAPPPKLGRKLLQLAAFGLFGLGNPLYLVACSGAGGDGDGEAYEYDRDDMVSVASGLEAAGPYSVGEYRITVQLPFDGRTAAREAPSSSGLAPSFFTRALACGTRSFVAPAAACIDSSEMQLRATFLVERGADVVELAATGTMRVDSRILTFADFYFEAGSLELSFAWDDDEGYRYQPSGTNDSAALAALFAP